MPSVPKRRPTNADPSSGAAAPGAPATAALTVFRSRAAQRLEALQREHERLLREIKKRRAACEVSEQSARDAATAFHVRVGPLRESFLALLGETQKIFRTLLGPESRLNRRDQARVRRLYDHVLPDFGLQGAEPSPDEAAGDFDPGRARARSGRDSEAAPEEPDAGYSAAKPAAKDSGLLKAVFRRLAIALHPDKVQDPVERETLTAVMKDVTRAYEAEDLARLVELERAWLCSDEPVQEDDGAERRAAQLLQANKELRRQLRTLTANLKDLKESARGFGVENPRGRARARHEVSEVDEVIASLEHDVASLRKLRDFAHSFQRGEIGLAEFLAGPAPGADDPHDVEQMLNDLVEAMLTEQGDVRSNPRRRRR